MGIKEEVIEILKRSEISLSCEDAENLSNLFKKSSEKDCGKEYLDGVNEYILSLKKEVK